MLQPRARRSVLLRAGRRAQEGGDIVLLACIGRTGEAASALRLDRVHQRRHSFSPLRRPANTVNPSAANLRAIALPMTSPASMTAAVAFLFAN
jgi:hypothetical protein